ncbi:COP9 signalosome, subunit CSN3 [Handroanthus impetiginosus]|uniref:COP9 signalosome complex subunit 3 n=1 Tax=Handroanthus impetiginosus TaxID=429701 RepID=A0A2G9G2A8_9LAMI|nr:COP9 signalosome, subunit CSN3 [Handroanthus impetiginosus]
MRRREGENREATNLNVNSLETLVTHIQVLSGNIADLTYLSNVLKQSGDWLQSEQTRLAPLLGELNPSMHSLGYLYILEAHISAPISKEQANELLLSVARFINACTAEQIHLAPEKFISVCRRFKDQVLLLDEPLRGVAPMLTALRKLQTSCEQLTALHPEFLLLCLLSKSYKTGLSILEDDIFDFDQPHDLFLYCYYGGMICIGHKRFRKALELLHNVVTAPRLIINIAAEAYKKYILVSLIHLGQFSTSFPPYTSGAARKYLKNFSQPYLALVESYDTGKISELETCVQTNKDKFESDKNLGLVKQVVSSMYKRNIQRLTRTYLTLSLQDIANRAKLNTAKEAEMHVLQMIQEGQIYATINQKDGMVRFLEDPEQYKTSEMINCIDSSIQRMMMLSKKLTTMDEMMSYDPSYIREAEKARSIFDFDDVDSLPLKPDIDAHLKDVSSSYDIDD